MAMQRYNNKSIYTRLERMNSILVICFQVLILYKVLNTYDGTHFIFIVSAFILAYLLTDFVNGLVHMYMDNNTRYNSVIGPFISSFHLHHARFIYSHKNVFKVYFYESGTKFWLLAYLIGVALAQSGLHLPYMLNVCLVSFGILSSIAEISHYLCHNATQKNKIITRLQKCHILLPKKHHSMHHLNDNTHYAFLNGMTDPLLNKISHYYYSGYKNHADQHTTAYMKLLKIENTEH